MKHLKNIKKLLKLSDKNLKKLVIEKFSCNTCNKIIFKYRKIDRNIIAQKHVDDNNKSCINVIIDDPILKKILSEKK